MRISSNFGHRGVAQFGSALRSGRRGRRFKSCYPDKYARRAASHAALLAFPRTRAEHRSVCAPLLALPLHCPASSLTWALHPSVSDALTTHGGGELKTPLASRTEHRPCCGRDGEVFIQGIASYDMSATDFPTRARLANLFTSEAEVKSRGAPYGSVARFPIVEGGGAATVDCDD